MLKTVPELARERGVTAKALRRWLHYRWERCTLADCPMGCAGEWYVGYKIRRKPKVNIDLLRSAHHIEFFSLQTHQPLPDRVAELEASRDELQRRVDMIAQVIGRMQRRV